MQKHALLIGIQYKEHILEGTIHDVLKIQKSLVGYDTVVMTDFLELKPTKENIVTEFKRLLQQKGKLFFYYSGHGLETEAILCLDGEVITQEEFRGYLEFMDKESTLVAVLDTCFSGDLFDLAYHWTQEWTNAVPNEGPNAVLNERLNEGPNEVNGWTYDGTPDTPGHVFLISSSQDDEVSFERIISGQFGGVFTNAYLKHLLPKKLTWRSLMQQVRQIPYQTPELSTGQAENIDGIVGI
jgi:hypothetical protein